ncbi:MAG: GTPase HflX [Clostridia bacterium]|nr:GTPase HflX [Clostridia bacterium]
MGLFDNEEKQQRVLLVSVDTGEYDAQSSLDELWELTESAGATPIATMTQKKDKPETATYVGSGRLEEITDFCENNDIDLLIFDCELTPTQIRNIEQATNVRTIDRTMLILDIFALRAKSKEGKLQVELAQLGYMLPRLTGKGIAMSRLGGGIGTRGPGETKLETDKRHIRRKMETLKEQLKEVETHRNMLKNRRKKDGIITVAIVGYTNAGKSTLMNYLTNAGVLAEDKLFATLDPTSRALKLPNGVSVMLIDTVGLVRRLPHHLVEAFKSTLEEAVFADIILNVCDASSEEALLHLEVTRDLLKSLGCENTAIIPVLNKWDKVENNRTTVPIVSHCVKISAKNGMGIDKLLQNIQDNLPVQIHSVSVCIPFANGGLVAEIRQKATLLSEEYTIDGIVVNALVKNDMYEKLKKYIIDESE